MSAEGEGAVGHVPKGRSPSYPGVSLETAIERAQMLYEHAQQHSMPIAAITSRWGYKAPTTGPATVTYAALKKYGLLNDEGTGDERTGRLTDLAVEILHPNPNQQDAIRRAAVMPPIHREWWEKYGTNLPPEDALRWEYVVKGPFTENGFKDFLRVFRDTIAFARLGTAELGESGPGGSALAAEDTVDELRDPPAAGRHESSEHRRDAWVGDSVMSYAIPVAAGVNVVIQGQFPLSESEWTQFLAVLDAMKPALTRPVDEPTGSQCLSEPTG